MSDELLPYYERELSFIRRLGAEFAAEHPKIAGRLRLMPEEAQDPHVERLLEGFAYLNARIRHKLDDDFPEIAEAMLGVVYPHYQAPLPSMAIVEFTLDRSQGELTGGYAIGRETALEVDSPDGEPCRFRTAYPVTLWPIEVVAANLLSRPFAAPAVPRTAEAVAVLRIELRCFSKEMTFAQLALPSLRFFLRGQGQHVFPLYELLFNNVLAVAVADSPKDAQPASLGRDCLRPVGFERGEGMFPYPTRSFLGYRLLTEYFTFPEKFLFVELGGLGPEVLKRRGNRLELYVYLGRSTVDLEQNVSGGMFRLGCTPIVNLYSQRAEPVKLTHTETEYRIVPDARRPWASEIFSIDRVTATSAEGEEAEYQPFYSFRHAVDRQQQATFWHAVRRPAAVAGAKGVQGTDVYLRPVDLDFSPSVPAEWTLSVETTCLNGNRPARLPFGEGQPRLRLTQGSPVARIECLTRPTPAFRPALKQGMLWRLISHLSLNHLSLSDSEEGAEALREILKLYDFADSAETRAMIGGILSVRSRRVVGRSGGPQGGVCRGLEVTIHFDEERFTGSGLFLFASVLERFLGLYATVNSFSRLVVTTNKREGELRRWPPRAGERILL